MKHLKPTVFLILDVQARPVFSVSIHSVIFGNKKWYEKYLFETEFFMEVIVLD